MLYIYIYIVYERKTEIINQIFYMWLNSFAQKVGIFQLIKYIFLSTLLLY